MVRGRAARHFESIIDSYDQPSITHFIQMVIWTIRQTEIKRKGTCGEGLQKPVNKGLTLLELRLSLSVHKTLEEGKRESEPKREKHTHTHMHTHFKALSSGHEESWFELNLILPLSLLSKFMAKEGGEGRGVRV